MTKTLDRPLFKKIKNDHRSTGITSGLAYRPGYKVGGRVGFKPGGAVDLSSINPNLRSKFESQQKPKFFSRDPSKTLDIFYLLHLETSDRKKIKPKKKEYFKYIFFKFPYEKRRIFIASNKSKILSISIFGIFKKNAIYWINASSNNALKIGGNHFLMWEALKYFKKMRFQFFEFGEGFFENNTNQDLLNLNHFKKSFGGEKYPLFRGKKTISIVKDMGICFLRFISKKI